MLSWLWLDRMLSNLETRNTGLCDQIRTTSPRPCPARCTIHLRTNESETVAVPSTVSAACPASDSPCPKAPLFATDASGRQSRALARTVAGLISGALRPSGAGASRTTTAGSGRPYSAVPAVLVPTLSVRERFQTRTRHVPSRVHLEAKSAAPSISA